MLMSVIDNSLTSQRYGELAGARVLITGLSDTVGLDIARAFADHRARMVLSTDVSVGSEDADGYIGMLGETAHEITRLDGTMSATAMAQAGAQAFGGLDAVVNLVAIDAVELAGLVDLDDIEDFVTDKLASALEVSRIVANRMRVLMTGGSILNVVILTGPVSSGAALIAGFVRSALAAITRREAEAWAEHGIRINAIGPRVSLPGERPAMGLASEPEMAALALYIASRRARGLSGHLFDAEGALTRCG